MVNKKEEPRVLAPSQEDQKPTAKRSLIGKGESQLVRDAMAREFDFCYQTDSYEEALQRMRKHGRSWLPVLDEGQKIVGIVSIPSKDTRGR